MAKKEIKQGEVVIYNSKEGPKLEVRLEKGTVWLTQKQMALLFDKGVPTINEHIKNIYKEGELKQNSTIWKFRIVQNQGGGDFINYSEIDNEEYGVSEVDKKLNRDFYKV